VEIITQAGVGPTRGGMNFNFRDNAWSAQNPFTPTKAQGQQRGAGGNIAGTIAREKADYFVSFNRFASYTMPELRAVLPSGLKSEVVGIKQPNSNVFVNGTL